MQRHHRNSPARWPTAVPFTLSHPAAVLPLRRCCPRRLDCPALVIGSMAPDFAYYLPGYEPPVATHSLVGSFVLCLPAGLMVLAAFHLLKRPVCFVLPQPHRGALTPLAIARRGWSATACFAAIVSVLLGAWTHIAWDSFTHVHGWAVERLSLLRTPLWPAGGRPFAVFDALQWSSGLAGALLLFWFYRRWLRLEAPTDDCGGDRWRYLLLAAIGAAALLLAVPAARSHAAAYRGALAVQVFTFQLWVHAAMFGVLLLITCSLLIDFRKRGWR
jgi:hypothetical protein